MAELKRYISYVDHPRTGHFLNIVKDEVYKVNGEYHREDGPAVIRRMGREEWWLFGYNYDFEEYVIEAKWTDEQIIEWKLIN